jgi:hypothetical protein
MTEMTKACPYCGEQILAVAIKCKHCGSALTRPAAAAPGPAAPVSSLGRQFTMRPAIAILAVIVLGLLGLAVAANWTHTHTLSGDGFSDAQIASIQQDIRAKFGARRGVTVVDVEMIRESPTQLTGFAKVQVPLLGIITKPCTATWGDGRSIWQCK